MPCMLHSYAPFCPTRNSGLVVQILLFNSSASATSSVGHCERTSEESGAIGGRKEKELVDDDLATGKHPTI